MYYTTNKTKGAHVRIYIKPTQQSRDSLPSSSSSLKAPGAATPSLFAGNAPAQGTRAQALEYSARSTVFNGRLQYKFTVGVLAEGASNRLFRLPSLRHQRLVSVILRRLRLNYRITLVTYNRTNFWFTTISIGIRIKIDTHVIVGRTLKKRLLII